jgi:hypothetical protein
MTDEYDDVLPVSLHRSRGGVYYLLDRHNDELAKFSPTMEIEDMERIVELVNISKLVQNQAKAWCEVLTELVVNYGLSPTEPGDIALKQVLNFLRRRVKPELGTN